jgi:hypothetical protein
LGEVAKGVGGDDGAERAGIGVRPGCLAGQRGAVAATGRLLREGDRAFAGRPPVLDIDDAVRRGAGIEEPDRQGWLSAG